MGNKFWIWSIISKLWNKVKDEDPIIIKGPLYYGQLLTPGDLVLVYLRDIDKLAGTLSFIQRQVITRRRKYPVQLIFDPREVVFELATPAHDLVEDFQNYREPGLHETTQVIFNAHEYLITSGKPRHDGIQMLLVKLAKYFGANSQKEFEFENKKLDVIWWRHPKSGPTHVFEVHLKGVITNSLSKLKYAKDLLRAKIFLIYNNTEIKDEVENLIRGPFVEIANDLKLIQWRKIKELYEIKKKYSRLEELLQ